MSSKWKTIKVFISSTFRDMHSERDHLVKVVFPELREKLEKHRIHLVDIDLRWGVTKEQAENDKALSLCLDMIDECRPFFIGILGERYGWVPETIPLDSISKYGWIQHYSGKSITELEIIHGVLNNPDMRSHAFFYFRDPSFISALPAEMRNVYMERPTEEEPGGHAYEDAEVRAEDRRKKLRELKERIRCSGFPFIGTYPCRWDPDVYDPPTGTKGRLAGLDVFGNSIKDQIWESVKSEYMLPELAPVETEIDPILEELDYHERFMDSRLRVYVGRDEIHRKLVQYIEGSVNLPLLVTGKSGSGKSAILSRICSALQGSGTVLIQHFVGASPKSTGIRHTLRRFCQILNRAFNLTGDVPEEMTELIESFQMLLHSAPQDRAVVIVMDGINQLDECDNAHELNWLPDRLPSNVKFIVSCLTAPDQGHLILYMARKQGLPELEVKPLSDVERMEIMDKVPSLSAKTLDNVQKGMLLENPATSNPLYLLVALEELRGFGSYEHLNDRIASFPFDAVSVDLLEKAGLSKDVMERAGNDELAAIFMQVIERLEQDFDREVVKAVLSLLAASRHGLSEKELKNILAETPCADHTFLVLRQLRPFLMYRGSLVDFFHHSLLKAVRTVYFSDPEAERYAHLRIAHYFENVEFSERTVDEFPWQIARAGLWEALKNCITDLRMFVHLTTEEKVYELVEYWQKLREKFDMTGCYQKALSNLESLKFDRIRLAAVISRTAEFFKLVGEYTAAVRLYEQAILINESLLEKDNPAVAKSLNGLALLLYHLGDYEKAEVFFLQALERADKSIGPEHPDVSAVLNNLATIYKVWGRYEKAEELLNRAVKIVEKIRSVKFHSLPIYLTNLAAIYQEKGELNKVEPLLRRSIDIFERNLGLEHPNVALAMNNLAGFYMDIRQYKRAESLLERAIDIWERKLGPDHPDLANALNNLAAIYRNSEQYDRSEALFRQVLQIWQKAFGSEHINVAKALSNLAEVLKAQKRYEEAEPLYQQALVVFEKVEGAGSLNVAYGLNALAGLYEDQGQFDEAEGLYRQTMLELEATLGGDHPAVSVCMRNLALLFDRRGSFEEAEPLFIQALTSQEKSLGPEHPDVAQSLNDLAEFYDKYEHCDRAEPLFIRALEIRKKSLKPEHIHIAQSMNSLAVFYHLRGQYDKAEPLYVQALGIMEKALGPEHPEIVTSLKAHILLYEAREQYDMAEPLYRRIIEIGERESGPDHPDVAATKEDLASLFVKSMRYEDAEPLYLEALATKERTLGAGHPDTGTTLNDLGIACHRQEKYGEAEKFFVRALSIREKELGADDPRLVTLLLNLVSTYRAQGEEEKAQELYSRALRIKLGAMGI